MKKTALFLFLAVMSACGCVSINIKGDSMLVKPDNKDLAYMGRIDFSSPESPRFDWPGVSIEIAFEGSQKCSVILADEGRNDFNIILDGKQAGVVKAEKGEKEYVLASGLGLGSHTIKLTKRTEAYDGVTVFKGFILDRGAKTAAVKKDRCMKIEFIGDSLTVGYGVEGDDVKCPTERDYKNNYLAFSSVAAREMCADYNVVAASGRGVVRNYGEETDSSAEPLPVHYGKTIMNDTEDTWDFKPFVPDAVVINLGTNDFSTEPKPGEAAFISGYVKLLDRVRSKYPEAHIFICVGPTQSEPFFKCMKTMLKGIQDKKVHEVIMAPLKAGDWGCDYHPNVKTAARMAKELVKEMRKVFVKIGKPGR
jgi:lysophospholipase L1-like esterase